MKKQKKQDASKTVRNVFESNDWKMRNVSNQEGSSLLAGSGGTQTAFDFSKLEPIGKGRMKGGAAAYTAQRSSLSSYQQSQAAKPRYVVRNNPLGLASSLGLKPANQAEIAQNIRKHQHAKYNSQERMNEVENSFPLGNQSLQHAAQIQGKNATLQSQ